MRGEGRADLSVIRGFGRDVALSVCRRASRRAFRIGNEFEGDDAKSTTEVDGLSDGFVSVRRGDFDRLRRFEFGGVSLRSSATASSSQEVDSK